MAKAFFERRAKHFVNFGWAHGRYFDNWSIVHILTGAILATAALVFNVTPNIAIVVIAAVLTVYELLEMISGIAEDFQNVISDIALGTASASIILYAVSKAVAHYNLLLILAGCVSVNLFFVNLGWRSYLKIRSSKGPMRSHSLMAFYLLYTFGIALVLVSLGYWTFGK
ncbi:MAG TPA: hypothetical protein VE973_02355 [Candidatus Limnocylindria bacterium]|nr:hypothetical protein [Candidatus Limnocylindria bacterium]